MVVSEIGFQEQHGTYPDCEISTTSTIVILSKSMWHYILQMSEIKIKIYMQKCY